jgi:hypothetical protein
MGCVKVGRCLIGNASALHSKDTGRPVPPAQAFCVGTRISKQ